MKVAMVQVWGVMVVAGFGWVWLGSKKALNVS